MGRKEEKKWESDKHDLKWKGKHDFSFWPFFFFAGFSTFRLVFLLLLDTHTHKRTDFCVYLVATDCLDWIESIATRKPNKIQGSSRLRGNKKDDDRANGESRRQQPLSAEQRLSRSRLIRIAKCPRFTSIKATLHKLKWSPIHFSQNLKSWLRRIKLLSRVIADGNGNAGRLGAAKSWSLSPTRPVEIVALAIAVSKSSYFVKKGDSHQIVIEDLASTTTSASTSQGVQQCRHFTLTQSKKSATSLRCQVGPW